jgi:CO/xanthine dehydrogenase FAD-binding subunit
MSMIIIGEYVKPKSVEEAYEYVATRSDATLFGGGAFIRLGSRTIGLAVDLSDTGMNYIKETESTIEIGGTTTFGDIERSELLRGYFDNILTRSVESIVGVQLRNIVTVGGTVYSKYGFSDPITALRALNTTVVLHKAGEISIHDFLTQPRKDKDILEKIIIKKENLRASFQMMRNSIGDYAILNAAVTKGENGFKIVVGARPGIATEPAKAIEFINSNEVNEETADMAGKIAAEELTFSDNNLGSKEYRAQLCRVLVKRGILEVSLCK